MADHTPGPWEIRKGAYDLSKDLSVWPEGAGRDGDKRIACWIRTPADAHLIAAAPDLLAACKAALVWVASNTPMVESSNPVLGPIADRADEVRELLRAAIARADGREDESR